MRTGGQDMPADHASARRKVRVLWMGMAACRTVSLTIVLVTLAGCRDSQELEVAYGQRRGAAARSINGTSVLAGMFEEAGFRVSTWRYLATELQRYDVIVWAPDDFGPPGDEARQFFDQWFASREPKTLVYIGRDYSAAPYYWESVLPSAPTAERIEVMRRQARAASQHDADRLDMPADETTEWFTMRRDYPRRRATQLHGSWSTGIDVAQTDIRTQGLLQIPTDKELLAMWKNAVPAEYRQPDYESLLNDGQTTLASRVTKPAWGDGRLIVVTNGSFLLNLPLVNHEHRKLAGHLIEECEPGSTVAFLESGPGKPPMSDRTSPPQSPQSTRERVLLAAHWCVLGLVYCFCIFPIFGRPQALPDTAPTEFIQHVDALGELLERTQDAPFARRQIAHYYTITRRDPNARHREVARTGGLRSGANLEKEPSPKSDTPA
jgi:hypothetical protein